MRYVSLDLETTGINPNTCDVLEFGAVLDDLQNINPIEDLPLFHCYFVKDVYSGEPNGLSMHSTIFKRIANREDGYRYCNAEKFSFLFKKFLLDNGYEEKHGRVLINVAGKNFGSFDLQFLKLKTDFLKHIALRHKILDPAILYYQKGDTELMGTLDCKKRAGLEEAVKHDAISDAIDVIKLIRGKMS